MAPQLANRQTESLIAIPSKWPPGSSRTARLSSSHRPVKSAAASAANQSEDQSMKIVVIGGTGLIGSKLVKKLRAMGEEVLAASPDSGVNTLTGEGLAEALAGAQVVVD